MSPGRRISLVVAALLGAALFVRLGFWQLDRRAERAAANAARAERLAEPTLDWTGSPPPDDSTGVVWRRARVTGRWDAANEIVLRSRSDLEGRPGVELLTPLLVEPDLALLVLRGWLPAADGLRADLALGWPSGVPRIPVTVEGVVIPPSEGRGGQPVDVEAAGGTHLAIAGIDIPLVADRLPYRVLAYPLRADDDDRPGLPRPPREIALDAGSHLSYAIQWFAFAAIALVGTAILLRKERGA